MIMKQTMTSQSLLILAGFGLALGSACGDDGGSSSSTPPKRPGKRAAPAAKAAAAAAGQGLATYVKVDPELRHEFTEIDFVPDVSGETNRDPFRSWVLNPILSTGDGSGDLKVVDVCTEGKVRWGAPDYSVRDLELIGLVKRGRSYAQFTDHSEKDSWIVRKGDCIGQEKAIIEEIGVGYVRLSITPPAPPGAPAPPAQKQDISLHPDELEIPDSIVGDFDDE
jgi:hypothetical protein